MPAGPLNCTLTPETDEGPYWVDQRLERSDVVDGQPGVPLTLRIEVYEQDPALTPYPGAVVDIWQANALGLYSDQREQPGGDTGGQTFLRGFQVTGADGAVRFETIYPGWYPERTLHVHVRVRAVSAGEVTYTFTTQTFFEEELNAAVLAETPYNERPDRDTTNAEDGIFLPELIAATDGTPATGVSADFRICLSGLPKS
jgi:protocatechuate 3,4-dioxygenase beta subunit